MRLMSGAMSTPIIWPKRSINEESPRPMKDYGMTSFSTLFEGSGTQEKKNDPGPFYNVSK